MMRNLVSQSALRILTSKIGRSEYLKFEASPLNRDGQLNPLFLPPPQTIFARAKCQKK